MCNNIGDIMRCVCSIVEQFSVFTSFLLVLEFELSYREPSKNFSMVSNSFLLFATFGQQSRILSRLVLVPFLSLLYYACPVSLSYLFDIVINSPTKCAMSAETNEFAPAINCRFQPWD